MIALLAILAGFFLTLNIFFTNNIAQVTSPMFGSFITHGVGTLVSLFIVFFENSYKKKKEFRTKKHTPLWAYLGGIPGALTMIIFAIVLGSGVPFSVMVCLVLSGQVIASMMTDVFGFFQVPKRKIDRRDMQTALLVLCGSMMILLKIGG